MQSLSLSSYDVLDTNMQVLLIHMLLMITQNIQQAASESSSQSEKSAS